MVAKYFCDVIQDLVSILRFILSADRTPLLNSSVEVAEGYASQAIGRGRNIAQTKRRCQGSVVRIGLAELRVSLSMKFGARFTSFCPPKPLPSRIGPSGSPFVLISCM